MATWVLNGIGTDGIAFELENGSQFELAATLFGEDVSLNSYQDSSHISLGGDHFCVNTHLNNTKYISSTQLQINNGTTVSINPATPVPTHIQVPLKVTFTHTTTIAVSNVIVEAFDPVAPTSGSIADMRIYALEAGNVNHTTWKNINGTPATLSPRTGASTYDWYLALSSSPIHGEPKTFGLRLALNWV